MSKHTPGPWQHKHFDALHIMSADSVGHGANPIARVSGGKNGETRAEAIANARLIAAAPDLLAALKRLAFAAECRDNTMGDQINLLVARAELAAAAKAANEVIAKATGAQP